jgi:hypothetical protein
MSELLECRSYAGLDQLFKRFDALYFPADGAHGLPEESEAFFSEVNDQLSWTSPDADLTLEEFQTWLREALSGYPELAEAWREKAPI